MKYTTQGPISNRVLLPPERHSFFRYPQVTLRRGVYRPPAGAMGSAAPASNGSISVTTGSTTADTVIKWGFWIGLGLATYRLYRVVRYDDSFFQFGGGVSPAWQMNPLNRDRLSDADLEKLDRALVLYEPGTNLTALARYLHMTPERLRGWLIREGVYRSSQGGKHGHKFTRSVSQRLRYRGRRNPEDEDLVRVCGWCKRMFVEGEWVPGVPETNHVTHGICEVCEEQVLREIEEYEEKESF